MEPSEIFAKAWQNGLPPEEQAEWSSVPKDRRDSVIRRLSALAALEAGEVNVGSAAALAGLSRQAFHKLRTRWENERSIRSLTPYRFRERTQTVTKNDKPVVGRSEASQSPDPFLAKALKTITEYPAETNGRLGRRLRKTLDEAISQPTAVELVRQARRLTALKPELLEDTYGKSLLIDFVGLRMDGVAVEGDRVTVAAIVLERASGIVLGLSVGDREAMPALQIDAVRGALETISRHQIDIETTRPVGCRIVVPDIEHTTETELRVARLRDLLTPKRVYADGMRRFGVRTTSIVGHKINRVRLFSRIGQGETGQAFRPYRVNSKSPKLQPEEFALLARSEVERYNEPLLARVQHLPGQSALTTYGAMASIFENILEILQTR